MTSAEVMLPRRQVQAAPASPVGGGLYQAASVQQVEAPERLDGGVDLLLVNDGDTGLWELGCDGPGDEVEKHGRGPGVSAFSATGVWAATECSLVGEDEQAARDRVQTLLRLGEPAEVSAWFAAAELVGGEDVTPASVPDDPVLALVAAVGALEQRLGSLPGVLHADRRMAALAYHAGLVQSAQGGRMLTPLGHRWAFGTGYDLGDTVVATGPVTLIQGPTSLFSQPGPRRNQRLLVAERVVAVAYEGPLVRAGLGV